MRTGPHGGAIGTVERDLDPPEKTGVGPHGGEDAMHVGFLGSFEGIDPPHVRAPRPLNAAIAQERLLDRQFGGVVELEPSGPKT